MSCWAPNRTKYWVELGPHLFEGILKFYANGADLSLFYGLGNGVNDPRSQLTFQLDFALLRLKRQYDGSILRRNSTQPDNEGSTQRKIGDLSPDDMVVPVEGAGNGNCKAFKSAPLFHLGDVDLTEL